MKCICIAVGTIGALSVLGATVVVAGGVMAGACLVSRIAPGAKRTAQRLAEDASDAVAGLRAGQRPP